MAADRVAQRIPHLLPFVPEGAGPRGGAKVGPELSENDVEVVEPSEPALQTPDGRRKPAERGAIEPRADLREVPQAPHLDSEAMESCRARVAPGLAMRRAYPIVPPRLGVVEGGREVDRGAPPKRKLEPFPETLQEVGVPLGLEVDP